MKNLAAAVAMIVPALLVGCGDKGTGGDTNKEETASGKSAKKAGASATASASAAPAASGPASAAPSAAPAADGDAFASFKDTDLSGFHKLWKGFSVKAPEGATISQGYGGPKISKGDEFSIQLSFADTSLDNTAEATKECASYEQRCAVVERTKDMVVTSTSDMAGKNTTYGFHMLIHPGGSLMACKGGAPDLAKLEIPKKACLSVEKK